MGAGGYESWFVSARDPASTRALWIRRTRNRPSHGSESVALWCTVADRELSARPVVVKQAFASFPADVVAGPRQFQGQAAMGARAARWSLSIGGGPPPLRPPRPQALYHTPLPRTKLEVSVPDGLVAGRLDVDGHRVEADGPRSTPAPASSPPSLGRDSGPRYR